VDDNPGDDSCLGRPVCAVARWPGTKASLKRLQLEYVDLIFCHRPDPYTPMEEIVRAMNWVIDQGWAFYWGTSEWSAAQLNEVRRSASLLGACQGRR